MSTTRIGIVGCGSIARAHLQAYRQCNVEVVAVYDLITESARQLATELQAMVAPSLARMATECELDAVSICTPPAAHLDNCRPFLEAGVAVLCEKPLEVDSDRAKALLDLAENSGTLFMTAFCHRFHPPVIELKRLIAEGVLGKPQFFRNLFGGWLDMDGQHRANPALSGGGSLIDHGCHALDLFRHLVGEPTGVQAMAGNIAQQIDVEDWGTMLLATDDEAYGNITASYSLKVCGNAVEWYGTKGTAIISYFDPAHPDLCYRLANASDWITVDCSQHPDRFTGEIRHFLQCLQSGEKPAITATDGYRASLIASAVYQSIREARRISL